MAKPVKNSPAPSVPLAPVSPGAPSAAVEAIVGKPKAGFDARRPFRMGWAFISGTFEYGLNHSSSWGRRGMWAGVGLGILAAISGAGLILPIAGAVAGLAAGAVGGMAFGAVTGGVKGVARVKRIENNAEAVAERAKDKPIRERAVAEGPDYRAAARQQRQRANYAIDRVLQEQRELQYDSWVDRAAAGSSNQGRGV